MTAQPPPRLVVVGGPNGAGKTTLARAYADAHGLRYLGADDIAAQLSPQDPAAARVAAGGHDVPEADVRRRYGRSLQQFLQRYRLLADDWLVVFNGEAGYVTVAEGAGGQMASVLDEARWAQLIEQAATGAAPDTEEHHD